MGRPRKVAMQKHVTQSKTVWVALVVSALALFWPGLDESISTQVAVLVEAVVFLLLRLVTSGKVYLR